jgi:hypothetical protein
MNTTMSFQSTASRALRRTPLSAAIAMSLLLVACGQRSDAPKASGPRAEASAAAEAALLVRIDPAMASRFTVAPAEMADLVPFKVKLKMFCQRSEDALFVIVMTAKPTLTI